MQNYMARIYTASGKEFTNPKFTSIFPKRIISGSLLRWKTASYCGDKTVFSTVCRRVFYLLKTKQDYFHHDIYLILDSRSTWVQWKVLLTSVKEFQKSQRQITPTPTPTPGKKIPLGGRFHFIELPPKVVHSLPHVHQADMLISKVGLLFLVTSVQFFSGFVPVVGQFLNIKCQLLIGWSGLLELFTEHVVDMLKACTPGKVRNNE